MIINEYICKVISYQRVVFVVDFFQMPVPMINVNVVGGLSYQIIKRIDVFHLLEGMKRG